MNRFVYDSTLKSLLKSGSDFNFHAVLKNNKKSHFFCTSWTKNEKMKKLSLVSSTSLPGGNLVDGLPPALNLIKKYSGWLSLFLRAPCQRLTMMIRVRELALWHPGIASAACAGAWRPSSTCASEQHRFQKTRKIKVPHVRDFNFLGFWQQSCPRQKLKRHGKRHQKHLGWPTRPKG